jgi:hypothetical protein
MKVLFFAVVLANIVVFMWEYRQGAFGQVTAPQQPGREPIVLVRELKKEVVNIDFISLYPPGLDPQFNNLLTEQLALTDF